MCLVCGKSPAQTERKFHRCCRVCFSEHFSGEEDEAVRAESDAYLASISEQQTWTGYEPALQLLLLPLNSSFEMPKYASEPDYLEPTHCRLCLTSYASGSEEQHLQECHECTKGQYRRMVLRKTLQEWPQAIPAQVLRTRLAAFKMELCDAVRRSALRLLLPIEA